MYIGDSRIDPSPVGRDFCRINLCVVAERSGTTLNYWFDAPADLVPEVVPSTALALLMLPLACQAGEHVRLDAPVDPVLLENLRGVQQIWRSWYPELAAVRIESPAEPRPASPARGTMASFSGGIDSFFSLLRHRDDITHLLSVAGFNTPEDDFACMRHRLEPVAGRFGKRHVPVRTNIRYGANAQTVYSINRWMNDLAHGCVLAAIAHLMQPHVGTYLLPASHDYSRLIPYGSHPLTDPLLSSAALRVVHDGAAFGRVERTQVVATCDEALSSVQVCFTPFGEGNCSRCQKCLRTMVTFDMLGVRARAITFDWSGYSLHRVASAWLPTENERIHFRHIGEHARALGRDDVAQAVALAIDRSRRKARVYDAFQAVKEPFVRGVKSNRFTAPAWNGLRALKARAT